MPTLTPVVVGVDPGRDGGVVGLTTDGGGLSFWSAMPTRKGPDGKREVCIVGLRDLLLDRKVVLFAVEQVTAAACGSKLAAFTFGRYYQVPLDLAGLMGWPLFPVRPQEWKATVLRGTDKSKQAAIAWANGRYPELGTDHDGVCEACCIADHALRVYGNPEHA